MDVCGRKCGRKCIHSYGTSIGMIYHVCSLSISGSPVSTLLMMQLQCLECQVLPKFGPEHVHGRYVVDMSACN